MGLRTIKFRGKSIESRKNGQWIYGCYLSDHDGYSSHELILDGITGFSYEVDPITVGQFTGVKYNDREIYEHDLIECAGVLCEIVHNDKIGAFVLLEVLTQNLGSKPIGQMIDLFCIKYVGNIYDHPELIKEE